MPFSPESELSGVGKQLRPDETLWYRRTVQIPDGFHQQDHRVLLHFGAVDQTCRVTVNGREAGRHEGGYLPFSFDITDLLEDGTGTLVVEVQDPSDTGDRGWGKQKLKRGGIWYTAQSGIWQTVWIECVPEVHVERLTLVPHLDEECVEVTVHATSNAPARIDVRANNEVIAHAETTANEPTRIPIADVRRWSPEDPFLYDITVELGGDRIESYVGMRSFGIGPDENGAPRLLLNGRPYFHAGVLDQGYWSDGMYTAPSDEALVHDIATMKRLGFTMLRKHIKVEPSRWYYHCDRLGILVWQDMVNGGGPYRPEVITAAAVSPLRLDDTKHKRFGRADAASRERFREEMRDTIEHLRNVVSIAVWVPFNEGWGQFDAADIVNEVKGSTRRGPSTTPADGTTRRPVTCAACTSISGVSGCPAAGTLASSSCPNTADTTCGSTATPSTTRTSATSATTPRPPRRRVRAAARAADRPGDPTRPQRDRLHPALGRGGRTQRPPHLRPRSLQTPGGPGPCGERAPHQRCRASSAHPVSPVEIDPRAVDFDTPAEMPEALVRLQSRPHPTRSARPSHGTDGTRPPPASR